MNPQFWLSVAFLMSRIGLNEAGDQCQPVETSVYGMYLKGHTFKTVQAGFSGECYMRCEQEDRCQSYNVIIGRNVCELNSRTKEARTEDFVPDYHRFYMRRANNRAPLGSIQKLPAETCSEIKASEGNEMSIGEHWIYTNEIAAERREAILARCEDTWQKINTDPVCFGARNDTYGAFSITKSGRVKAIKLVRKSGSIDCNKVTSDSYWGCTHSAYGDNALMTVITDANREAVLPPIEDMKALGEKNACSNKTFYNLEGTGHKSPVLVFRNLSSPLSLTRNQELQIWYGQDWRDCSESKNSGATCVDVYAWYI